MKRTIVFVLLGWMTLMGINGPTTAKSADEITLTVYLKALKGNASLTRNPSTAQIDWAGTRYFSSLLKLSTSWLPLSKGSVDTNGICYVQNMSTNITEYLSFDCGATTNLSLKAGEFFIFRIDPAFSFTNISVKAASGTPDCETTVLED